MGWRLKEVIRIQFQCFLRVHVCLPHVSIHLRRATMTGRLEPRHNPGLGRSHLCKLHFLVRYLIFPLSLPLTVFVPEQPLGSLDILTSS